MRIYSFDNLNDRQEVLSLLQEKHQTSGTELISFYCKTNADQKIPKLREQYNQARSIKSKTTQKKVMDALETLIDVLLNMPKELKQKSFVIFVKEKFYAVVDLPEDLAKNAYICGKQFDLKDLLVYSNLTWGLLVLDTQEVSIGILKNDYIKVLSNYEVFIPGKMRAGGQSQMRFEETRKNLVYDHIKRVSEKCNSLFKEYNVSKILLGGMTPTVDLFYKYNELTPPLKKILEYPVNTIYTNKKGLEQVLLKKRKDYEKEMELYFLEAQTYQELMKKRSDYKTKGELYNLTNYEVLKVYTVEPNERSTPYCVECKCLKTYCDHQSTPLGQLAEFFYFRKESDLGTCFNKYLHTLYLIKFIDL